MTTVWLIIDWLRPVFGVTAFIAPFLFLGVGLVLALRRGARGGRGSAALTAVQGFGLGIAVAPILLWLALCTPSPGEGRLAREGIRRGTVIVDALDQYRVAHGHYPDSLRQLVPALLDADVIEHPTDSRKEIPWEYRRDSAASFALSFRYVGPGMNRCALTPPTRAWQCSGYF